MTLKKSNLWDASALDDDLLLPPAPQLSAPAVDVSATSVSPAPHLVVAPPPLAGTPGPKKRTEPRRHIMVTLDVDLIDAIRQRDWGQLTLAQVLEKVLRQHFDDVVAGINQPRPRSAGQAQWGVRLPVPVYDLLTQTRTAAEGATQRSAVESALRVALRRS